MGAPAVGSMSSFSLFVCISAYILTDVKFGFSSSISKKKEKKNPDEDHVHSRRTPPRGFILVPTP